MRSIAAAIFVHCNILQCSIIGQISPVNRFFREFIHKFGIWILRKNIPLGKYMLEIRVKPYYFPVRERKMTPKQIGTLIRATRKLQGLRQDELAAAAGVGLRFLVELEAGKATAQLGKTLAVLAALGCAIDITPPDGDRQ